MSAQYARKLKEQKWIEIDAKDLEENWSEIDGDEADDDIHKSTLKKLTDDEGQD